MFWTSISRWLIMNNIIVAISLLSIIWIGYVFSSIFGFFKNLGLFHKLPYLFGIGVGLIGIQLFIYSYFSLGWDLEKILAPWLVMSLVTLYKSTYTFPKIQIKLSSLEKLLTVSIVTILIYVCLESTLRPLSAWDGWAIWVLKAKMFFEDGYLNPNVYHLLQENYPYVINLSIVYLLKFLAIFDDTSILLLFYSFYLFTVIVFYVNLKEYTTRFIAIFFTFLLLTTQNFLRHGGRFEAGYADLALGFYIFTSTMLLFRFLASSKKQDLAIFGIFLTITSLIKEEGLIFSLALSLIAGAYLLYKRKYFHLAILPLTLMPTFFWQLYKIQNDLTYSLYANTALHLQRLLDVILEIIYEMSNIRNWNLLWIVFAIAIYLGLKIKIRKARLVLIIIGVQLLAYIFVFLLSPHNPADHVSNTMNRLLLHIFPLVVFYIALVFSKVIRRF